MPGAIRYQFQIRVSQGTKIQTLIHGFELPIPPFIGLELAFPTIRGNIKIARVVLDMHAPEDGEIIFEPIELGKFAKLDDVVGEFVNDGWKKV